MIAKSQLVKFGCYLIAVFLLLLSSDLSAQDVSVSGQVIDGETEQSLPGVNIMVKGTSSGTTTDAEGNFSLPVPSLQDTLIFSYIGYREEEVPINGREEIQVTMVTQAYSGDEVVVVGYGTMSKSDLTGSVSSVSSDEINTYPAQDMTEALQGKISGVQIQRVNGGEPGTGMRIRVRGGTSINAGSEPLYVVDGFPGGTPPPQEDIESIEVLKDASATAIYGSRGANGVVLITTKSGQAGDTQINFEASNSFQTVSNRLDVLNASEFADFMNDIHLNDGGDPNALPYENPSSLGAGTDWQDQILRDGYLQDYQLSINGGSEDIQYYLSGNVYDQKGVILNSSYQKVDLTSNLDAQLSDKLDIGGKLFYSRSEASGVRTQEGSGGSSNTGVIAGALKFEPTQGIYDENNEFTISEVGDPHDNPYAVATQQEDNETNDLFQGNFFGEYSFTDNLYLRVSLGGKVINDRDGSFVPTSLVAGRNTGGTGGISAGKSTNLINENYLNFSETFNESHTINLMGGYSYQFYRSEGWSASNQNFISDSFSYWNLGGGSNFQSPSSSLSRWKLASWYGRVNYNYNDRYLLTFTGRYDGSSRFGSNNKWAFFPSGALAWNITNEEFLQESDFLTNLKARASYGITGNTEIGTYQSLARLTPVFITIGGSPVNAIRPSDVANNDLTWESTTQYDFGLDAEFYEGRVSASADYYNKTTDDLLYDVPLPEYSGYGTSLQNIGSVQNKGFEFSLTTRNLQGPLSWNTNFNISINRNEILELAGGDVRYSEAPGHMVATDSQILREGEVVGAFYGWIFDGIYQEGDDFSAEPNKQPGDVKLRDINGMDEDGNLTGEPDGVVNNADQTIIGNPHPDYMWGLTNEFRYNNFDLNVFVQASMGNDMMNFTRMELEWMSGKSNQLSTATNRWTPNNTDTNIPRASSTHPPEVSSRWVEDGSYVRVKNISLGYTLPSQLIEGSGIRRARIYVSGQNLLTFTNYSGYDPEVSYQNSNTNVGLDYASYPNVKSLTLGVSLGL